MSTTAVSSAAVQKQLQQGKVKKGIFSVIRHLVLALLAFIWLVPIAWLLLTSFSTDKGVNFTRFVPESFTMWNYVSVLMEPDSVAQFPRWFMNTLVVACFNCVISTCFVLMVAYAISCCRFKGRKLLQNLSVTVNLFPGVLAMIAVYFVLKYMNLTNSFWVYVIPGMVSAFNVLVMRTFMEGLPSALEESAMIDGANDFTIFTRIISPLCKPVYATVALFVAVGQWNSWFDAMLYNRMNTQYTTLQYELMKLLSSVMQQSGSATTGGNTATAAVTPVTVRSAATVVTMLPIILLYPFLQRYFVSGMTIGSVKE